MLFFIHKRGYLKKRIKQKENNMIKNKMENNLTELVFILDRSGSMGGLEGDTIGGYNSVIARQKNEQGEALVTTVLFDDRVELLHDRVNIKELSAISEQDYYVRGSTALLDAVGKTITKIVRTERQTSDDLRADKVMFVIITDGMENASREYNFEKVKDMIQHEKEKYGWEFVFLGANIDAVSAASDIGISSNRAANYNPDKKGTRLNYEAINSVVSELRMNNCVGEGWKAHIDEDFKTRGKKKKS